jgi:hypothetical protein
MHTTNRFYALLGTLVPSLMLSAWTGGVLSAQETSRPLSKYIKNYDDGKRSSTKDANTDPADSSSDETPSKKDGAIPVHTDHIFNGGINRSDHLVGCHHKPSAPKQMRVDGKLCDVEIKQTSPGSEKDVVTAKVILSDPASGSVVREKFSTLFPSAWSKEEIVDAIREAYTYAKTHGEVERNGAFHGKARSIKIDGYLTERGDAIATAYPVYQPAAKKAKGTHRD